MTVTITTTNYNQITLNDVDYPSESFMLKVLNLRSFYYLSEKFGNNLNYSNPSIISWFDTYGKLALNDLKQHCEELNAAHKETPRLFQIILNSEDRNRNKDQLSSRGFS